MSTSTGALANPYCRVVEPFQTSLRGLATYVVPKIDVNISATWRSDPGNDLAANYVVSNAIASQSLGRNLSACAPTGACVANVTVNLVQPGTVYGARVNNLDMRVAKILRFHGTRAQLGVDVYNLTNTDVVTAYNQGYSAPNPQTGAPSNWLTPTAILPARYVRLNMQIDF